MHDRHLRPLRLAAAAFASVCALLVARVASATPNFPVAVQSDLGLAAPPDCSLCHTDGDVGGRGTANQPFAVHLRERGLVAFDTSALKSALEAIAAEKIDSDGDCTDDVDELKAGTSPNTADPGGCDGGAPATPSAIAAGPSYGCAVAAAGAGGRPGGTIALALALVFGLALGYALSRRRRFAAAGRTNPVTKFFST